MAYTVNFHETTGENIIKHIAEFLSCLAQINAFDS